MKKALIHDWYYINGGAEKVIHSFNTLWNDFDHYALVDFLNEDDRSFILNGATVNTSFIQKLPTARSNHRKFLQLFPYAIEQFDLQHYDLIISSSASIAKGVLTTQDQLHICYCHSPMRYAWDLYHQYLKESNLDKGLKGIYAKWVLSKMRLWDLASVNRVDHFIANSNYIAKRIKKLYQRESEVIYPPVDIHRFTLQEEKKDFYLTASRLVPYKKIDIIIEAFNQMPNKKLIVIGDGPEFKKLNRLAGSNVQLKGYLKSEDLKTYMQDAKGFVFAAKEDFGIIPVEAQACGTPVIAFNAGGLKETVIAHETGLFFDQQTSKSIKDSIQTFENLSFDPIKIRENATRFSKERFEKEMKDYVEKKFYAFKNL